MIKLSRTLGRINMYTYSPDVTILVAISILVLLPGISESGEAFLGLDRRSVMANASGSSYLVTSRPSVLRQSSVIPNTYTFVAWRIYPPEPDMLIIG
jgi:hypothetical protein